MYHVVNSTGSLRYRWLNGNSSALLEGNRKIEKYVFQVEPSSLAPLLGRGFVYENVTMSGRWTHEAGYALDRNYWLVPFLWSGKVNVVSVNSYGDILPSTPISITIHRLCRHKNRELVSRPRYDEMAGLALTEVRS